MPFCFFFFNDTATTEIYTLSLHDALPISNNVVGVEVADDHELWERICSRDANAFEAFYCDNAARLGAYLRSEEHTSELQSQSNLVCRLLLEKKKYTICSRY